jgi:hypothetical protein
LNSVGIVKIMGNFVDEINAFYIMNWTSGFWGSRGGILHIKEMFLDVMLPKSQLVMFYLDCLLDWIEKSPRDW